jgi:hypothetical protein
VNAPAGDRGLESLAEVFANYKKPALAGSPDRFITQIQTPVTDYSEMSNIRTQPAAFERVATTGSKESILRNQKACDVCRSRKTKVAHSIYPETGTSHGTNLP